jgi:hypothetical protein
MARHICFTILLIHPVHPSGQPAILLKIQEKHDNQIADF